MIPENVTLIVKAPNQQIDDQNIECQSSWTVGQLKGHLAEVYPSKPRTDEQKIIYSGQLLEDNTVLKDVLRTYESQIAHIMHLVCTPKRRMTEPQTKPEQTEGLRRRNVVTEETERPVEAAARPETRQNDQNHTVEMQNYLSSYVNNYGRVPPYPNYNLGEGYLPVPNDPAMLANHMLMMQQAYLQYMQQYANMWQATAGVAAPPPAAPAPAPAPEPPAAPPAAPARAPPAAPEEPDDALAARDWLDHLYAASRLAILFSLVYLYGSPARFLLVLLLAAAGYLHQIGFFRDLHVNPANENAQREQPQVNRPENPPNQAEQNQPPNQPNQDRTPNQPNQNQQPNQPPNQPDQNQPPNQPGQNQPPNQPNPTQPPTEEATAAPNETTIANDNQSLLAVTWMIFTSFFASLIPDTN